MLDLNTDLDTRAQNTLCRYCTCTTTVNSWLLTKDHRSICKSMPTKRSYKIVAALTTINPPLADIN